MISNEIYFLYLLVVMAAVFGIFILRSTAKPSVTEPDNSMLAMASDFAPLAEENDNE